MLEHVIQNLKGRFEKQAGIRKQTVTKKNIEKEKDKIRPLIRSMKDCEGLSWNEIAERLNDSGYKTPTGRGVWRDVTIKRLYDEKKFDTKDGKTTDMVEKLIFGNQPVVKSLYRSGYSASDFRSFSMIPQFKSG